MASIFYTVGTQPLYDERLAIGDPVVCHSGKWAFQSIEEAKEALPRIADSVAWPAIYEVKVTSPGHAIERQVLRVGTGVVTRRVWPGPRGDLKP